MLIVTEHLHNGFVLILFQKRFYRYLHKSHNSVSVANRSKPAASALFRIVIDSVLTVLRLFCKNIRQQLQNTTEI